MAWKQRVRASGLFCVAVLSWGGLTWYAFLGVGGHVVLREMLTAAAQAVSRAVPSAERSEAVRQRGTPDEPEGVSSASAPLLDRCSTSPNDCGHTVSAIIGMLEAAHAHPHLSDTARMVLQQRRESLQRGNL